MGEITGAPGLVEQDRGSSIPAKNGTDRFGNKGHRLGGQPATLASRWGHSPSPPARCNSLDDFWLLHLIFILYFGICFLLLFSFSDAVNSPFYWHVIFSFSFSLLSLSLHSYMKTYCVPGTCPDTTKCEADQGQQGLWVMDADFSDLRPCFSSIKLHKNHRGISWICRLWSRKSG